MFNSLQNFFFKEDDDSLIEKDFLNNSSEEILGSNPLKKKAFFLKDLSTYKLVVKKSKYIIYEELSNNITTRKSFKADYFFVN